MECQMQSGPKTDNVMNAQLTSSEVFNAKDNNLHRKPHQIKFIRTKVFVPQISTLELCAAFELRMFKIE